MREPPQYMDHENSTKPETEIENVIKHVPSLHHLTILATPRTLLILSYVIMITIAKTFINVIITTTLIIINAIISIHTTIMIIIIMFNFALQRSSKQQKVTVVSLIMWQHGGTGWRPHPHQISILPSTPSPKSKPSPCS